jgi:CBS domain containing-hemolysin-like protein
LNSLINNLLGLVAVAVLILLNGFFVAAEFALVSIRRTRVDQLIAQGNRAAKMVRKAVEDMDQMIAAIQLGITLASLGLGWIGEPAMAHLLDPLIETIPIPESWVNFTAHSLSAALAFSIITLLHVAIGELAPKSIALQKPEQTAMIVAQPTLWVEAIFRPAVWVLNGIGNLILRILGFDPAAGHELAHSLEEIRMLLAASATRGLLDEDEHNMLDAIFDLRLILVRQVMIPRTEMATIPVEATLHDLMLLQKAHPYAKIPVHEQNPDNIVGVIYVRDVIDDLADGNLNVPVRNFMRSAVYIPETARINVALNMFQESRQHIAIVLDEYGGTAGLLTLEDILEEIAGEMPDQFESEGPDIIRQTDGTWKINGLTLIEEVNEALSLSLTDDNYDTIGGYVMGKLERVPQRGDEVEVDNVQFRVEQIDGMRIAQLKVTIQKQ